MNKIIAKNNSLYLLNVAYTNGLFSVCMVS